MYTEQHAPLGDVAFRCEPWELFNSAADIWGLAVANVDDPGLAERMEECAEWYEGMGRTLQDVRGLPDCEIAF
jgi:hypothetical protein